MNELLEKNQEISIVPQDFRYSNKGKVVDIQDMTFSLEIFHAPDGIFPKKILEFYSQTKHGMLYFVSSVIEINDKILKVSIPRKHRFLQRRAYTRINFIQEMDLKFDNKAYSISSLDLSAGGMKMETKELLDIETEYNLAIKLLDEHCVECKYEIIKIQKSENGLYTLAGRFKNLSNADKMRIIQFCMSKNIENANR